MLDVGENHVELTPFAIDRSHRAPTGAAVPDGKGLESSSWARFLGLAASVGAALASLLTLFVWPAVHSSAHDLPLRCPDLVRGAAADRRFGVPARTVSVLRVILEHALLPVRSGAEDEFLEAFDEAKQIIASMTGFRRLRLSRCIERPTTFLLLVEWETLEDHTEGFRGSAEYQEWRQLLHHFYDPFPTVEHFKQVLEV